MYPPRPTQVESEFYPSASNQGYQDNGYQNMAPEGQFNVNQGHASTLLTQPPSDRFAQMSIKQNDIQQPNYAHDSGVYGDQYSTPAQTLQNPHFPPQAAMQQQHPAGMQHASFPGTQYPPNSQSAQSPNYPPNVSHMNMQQPQYTSAQSPHPGMQTSNYPMAPPMPPMPQSTNPANYPAQNDPSLNHHSPQYAPGLNMPPQNTAGRYNQPPQPPYSNGPNASLPGPPQPAKRMSSEGLPSAVEVIENNRTQCTGPFYTGQRGCLPPLVTTDFPCRDEGNCNPRFVRSSLYAVPTTADLIKTVGVPLTLTISPFATLHPEDQPIMISDLGPQGPVRCTRCKAYISPLVSFIDGGRRFQCPLCNGLTEVPEQYFAHLDHTGRRTDTFQRPELCLGSYELLATQEYCKNNVLPQAPAFIFILDVSQASLRSGLVSLFCSQFTERILPNLPREDYDTEGAPSPIKLGFITYDHQLHFYTCGRDSDSSTDNAMQQNGNPVPPNTYNVSRQPQMHIVADIEDVFVPAVDGFLISPDPAAIANLLCLIPTQFCTDGGQSQGTPDALLGPAIQAGVEALKAANRPGKLFVMHFNLPTADAPGKLKNRDDRRLVGTEKEKTLLMPASDFYTGLGQVCVAAGCSVDLFLFPSSYTDIATLAEVPRLTAGHIYKYNCFQADLQGNEFLSDLAVAFSQPKAFDCVMRVRTSTGIRPVEFYGNCNIPNTTDIELAAADSQTGITVEIRHDDKLQENDVAFIQVACLYTSVSGQRRLRIHNLSLATTSAIPDMFRLSELDTHMNFVGKVALRALGNRAHPHVVEDLAARTAHTLAAYRRHCTGGPGDMNASPGELVLPQNMKLFPLYIQCLMKTDAFMPADNISVDDRSLLIFLFNSMDVKQSSTFIYPRLYPVHALAPNFEGQLIYPPMAIRCSYERLSPDGAYLLENGVNLFLWLGANLSAEWIQSVLNAPTARHMEPERIYELPRLENSTSQLLCSLVDQIHHEHGRSMRIVVIRPGDKLEACFKRFMVEDRHSGSAVSYVEYLCHIHKEVCSLLR